MPHLNAAYNLSRWLTHNADDAHDLVQESYLKAFRSFEGFGGSDASTARVWLLAVVRNTCYSYLKKKEKRPALEFDEEFHSGGTTAGDPESLLLNRASAQSLQGCVEKLPLEWRETVVLRELEELSYKEISGITGVPIGTVMSRLARARKRLGECVGESMR